jgi:hypothetical protein
MRVLVMNSLEIEYHHDCTQSKYLDFVGYRNELSMISMTMALLQSRIQNITSVSLDKSNLKEWQTFALMYRAGKGKTMSVKRYIKCPSLYMLDNNEGQEDVYRVVLTKLEEMKRNLIQKMAQDSKENRIAQKTPFLSILNQDMVKEKHEDSVELDGSPFLSTDMVLIDIRKLLSKDKAYSDVISELFEDFEQEGDVIMMLSLIHERQNPDSEWKDFFDKTTR